MNLYQLNASYLEAVSVMEASDFDEETVKDTLDGMEYELEEKLKSCAFYIKNSESDIQGLEDEIDRLTKTKRSLENRCDRIKGYMLSSMLDSGVEVKDPVMPVKLANCPPSIDVTDEKEIPGNYFRIAAPALDKRKLLEDAKEGDIPGVKLVTDKKRLKIG